MSEFTLEIGNRINNELSPVYNMWERWIAFLKVSIGG